MKYLRNSDEPQDPEEMCLHCHALIPGRTRICPFCGRIWYEADDNTPTTE